MAFALRPRSARLLPLGILATLALSACQLPGMPGGAAAVKASPSPTDTCAIAAPSDAAAVSGISNPGGRTPIHSWTSRLPSSWTAHRETSLKSGVSFKADASDSTDASRTSFVNVSVGTTMIGSSAQALTIGKAFLDEYNGIKKDGFLLDSRQDNCQMDGESAMGQGATKTDSSGKLDIYEVIVVRHGTDSLFNKPSATQYTIVGGAYGNNKAGMVKAIRGMAASWKWLADTTATALPTPTDDASLTTTLRFAGAFEVHGAQAFSGSYVARVPVGAASCASLASLGDQSPRNDLKFWPIPPGADATIAGHTVNFAGLLYYKTYGSFQIDGSLKSQEPSLNANALAIDGKKYGLDTGTRATATIKPDASGSLTFTNLKEPSSGGLVSGSTTWTCSNS